MTISRVCRVTRPNQDGYESTVIEDGTGLGLIFKTQIEFRAGSGFVIICPAPDIKLQVYPLYLTKYQKTPPINICFLSLPQCYSPSTQKSLILTIFKRLALRLIFPAQKIYISHFESLGEKRDRAHSLWRRQSLQLHFMPS